jgi:pentatricopeptide repeat protein
MQRPTTSGHPVKQCLPTVQTWTIYLHGFTRHGKMELAEQVLTYMRNKGLEPDVVTWNNIVQGYAKKQDEEGLLGALDRLEEGGHEWTKYTVDGMKWYRKQEELSEVLRKREQAAVELSFVTDLKSQLRERFELEGDNGGEKTDVEYKPFA